MPRKSAEAQSAAYWRNGGKPIAPPAHLDTKVKRVWVGITQSKPPDYFSPSCAPLLEALCEAIVMRRFYSELWIKDMADRDRCLKSIIALNGSIAQLSTKLRLALTSVDKKSGILTEREPDAGDGDNVVTDVLFGEGRVRF